MLRVLGIDPGSRVCGYGLIVVRSGEDAGPREHRSGGSPVIDPSRGGFAVAGAPKDELACAECGVLTARADQPMERRLGEIARGLREVIDDLTPEAVAVEAVFAHINVKSALALAQARGMVLAIAGLIGLPVFTYEPAVVKKTVVGSGRAGKDQVARMVAGMVGLRTLPSADAADALAIAITHARLCRPSSARMVAAVRPPSGVRA